jgi:hypothetical protein
MNNSRAIFWITRRATTLTTVLLALLLFAGKSVQAADYYFSATEAIPVALVRN